MNRMEKEALGQSFKLLLCQWGCMVMLLPLTIVVQWYAQLFQPKWNAKTAFLKMDYIMYRTRTKRGTAMKVNIILYLCLFISFPTIGQDQSLRFKHLTMEDGLSQSSVAPIIKDSQGFMWFGTEDGLNRYDGTTFKIYRHQPDDAESLSNSYISAIVEHEDGFLWVGTKNGLNYFDPNTEKFQRFLLNPGDTQSLGNNVINSLEITSDGSLLVGTADGLYSHKAERGFQRISAKENNKPHIITAVSQDSSGNLWVLTTDTLEKISHKPGSQPVIQKSLKVFYEGDLLLDESHVWIGTKGGLIKFNMETLESENFLFYGSNDPTDGRNRIFAITEAPDGKLWLGSSGEGLILFDKATGNFEAFVHEPNNRLSLSSKGVVSIFQDDTGILWVGTYSGGINKYDPNQIEFKHIKHEPGNRNSLSGNLVRSVLRDRDGELWVGTHNGLNRTNPITGKNTIYTHNVYNPSSISANIIRSLVEDSKGNIWAGTWYHGLNSFDKKTGEFKRYRHLPGQKDSINHIPVLAIDHQDQIWIGSNGLWKFNPKNQKSKNYLFNENNRPKYYVRSLHFGNNSNLWIGTNVYGLIRLDTVSGAIEQFLNDPKEPSSLSNNTVVSLASDKEGRLWIGTYGGGLNVLDPYTESFRHYDTSNGLLNEVIYGILIDDQGFIWFTSNAGLCRFDPKSEELKHFGVEYGIQSDEFNAGAYHKSKEGEFFFGGINGFNAFYPTRIYKDLKTERIVFTDFEVIDAKNTIPEHGFLDKSIFRAEQIQLDYDQNTFVIKFAELNYSDNVDHSFEYQLEGSEALWRDLGKKKSITLGNLRPGNYILHVRTQGDLTKKASIKIAISPPFWDNYWAYALYLLTAFTIMAIAYRNKRRFERARKEFELKITNWENGIKTTSPQKDKKDTVGADLQVTEIVTTSMNQKFLERAIQIVEENIGDSSFDVDKFMGEMFMSRSQLHRKLKAATGYSTTKFIRLIRLKRAAQLLKGNAGTVTEIAYKVGFENVGYFSKCFNDTFGTPPSRYND